MKDKDSIILENIYIEKILKENTPRQRGYMKTLWDRLAGQPLNHSTSISRNQLIDMYKKVWKSYEDDLDSKNAISRNSPIAVTLDYLANFLQQNYSQIETSKIVDPLALTYSPTGDFNEELDEQTIGDFLYDALSEYYISVGGMDKGIGNLKVSQVPQQTPTPSVPQQTPTPSVPQQTPTPSAPQQTKKPYKLPRRQTQKEKEEKKEKGFLNRLIKKQKDDWKTTTKRTKSQIQNT